MPGAGTHTLRIRARYHRMNGTGANIVYGPTKRAAAVTLTARDVCAQGTIRYARPAPDPPYPAPQNPSKAVGFDYTGGCHASGITRYTLYGFGANSTNPIFVGRNGQRIYGHRGAAPDKWTPSVEANAVRVWFE